MLQGLLAVAIAAVALRLPPAEARPGPVAAGAGFACALFEGGAVKCWGYNTSGQLGIGSTAAVGLFPGQMGDSLKPVLLGTGAVAVKIAAGDLHACAILDNGKIKCWGYNFYGQLGLGDTTDRGTTAASMGDSLPIVDLGTDYEAMEIACGDFHTCAILADGRLKCWGINGSGQLGLGDTNNRGDNSGEMGDALPFVQVQGSDLIAVAVALGHAHTCAISLSGDLFCWGSNIVGELGHGTPEINWFGGAPGDMENLQPVNLGAGRSAIGISLGDAHTCVLLNVGDIACFGYNGEGQIGAGWSWTVGEEADELGDNLQTANLGSGRSAAQVAAAYRRTCAVLDNGDVKCWGNSIGPRPNEMGDNLPAVNLGTGRTAVWIGVGAGFTCALLDDGSLKCWGANNAGQLGQGNDVSRGGSGDVMGDTLPPIDFGTSSTITDFCQLGEYGTLGDCTSCPAGTWAPIGITSEKECMTCEPGTFAPEGAAGCYEEVEDCPAGKYASSARDTCLNCPAGTFSNVGGAEDISACLPCEPGSYAGKAGSIECILCPKGTWSDTPATTTAATCNLCPAGKYSDVEGATSEATCQSCVAGTYSTKPGGPNSESCTPCAAGKYSEEVGAADPNTCQNCPADTYSSAAGAMDSSTCLPCPQKTHTEGEGASDVRMCKEQVEDDQEEPQEEVQEGKKEGTAAVAVAVAFGLLTGLVAVVVGAVLLVRRSG